MIVKEKRQADVSSNIEAKSFDIGDQAIVMRTLSNLYDQPMLAVIREISCNAVDAHIDNGNGNEPFDLYISAKEIAWRDYGVGMSHEFCEDIYFSYGKSTKRNSNDHTGYFGLGSKSPLGYTDVMFVDTWKDGVKNSYQVTFVEFKGPQYRHILSQPSTEPSGTKIYFKPKTLYDTQTFLNYAKEIFPYFSVKPNLYYNGQKCDIPKIEYTTKENKFKLKTSGYSKIVMGNIAYDLNTQKWQDHLSDKEKSVLDNAKIDLFFDIGDLEITPTREEVQLTAGNILKVRSVLGTVIDDITKEFRKELNNASNLWEARLIWSKSKNYAKNLVDPEYNGTKFQISTSWYTGKENSTAYIDFSNENWDPVKVGEVTHKRNKLINYKINETIRFVINDLNKGAVSRCRKEYQKTNDVIILVEDDDKFKDRIKEICGFDDTYFENASDLEATVSSPGKRGKTEDFCLFDPDYESVSFAWKTPTISPDDGGYYIELFRYYGKYNDKIYKQNDLRYILDLFKRLKYDINIHGIRTHKSTKFLEEYDDWTNIVDFAKEIIDKATNQSYTLCSRNPSWIVNPNVLKVLKFENLNQYYNDALKSYQGVNYTSTHDILRRLALVLGLDTPKFQIDDWVDTINKEVDRYPLLNLLDRNQNLSHASKYIQLVEKGQI